MLDGVSLNPAQYTFKPELNRVVGLSAEEISRNQPISGQEMATADKVELSDKVLKKTGINPCKTCEQRTYQDSSNDPGVSFKAPTHISPEAAASAVSAHEGEHVANEQASANSEGREVVYQSVTIYTASCPECGRSYVAGGETKTMTKSKPQRSESGQTLDKYA